MNRDPNRVERNPGAAVSEPTTFEMPSGIEWVVDAYDCDPAALRDSDQIAALCNRIVSELALNVVGAPSIHSFGGAGGVTALYLLSESHLACHTYPEHAFATFNLYCCRRREPWPWRERLAAWIGAGRVDVRQLSRGRLASGADRTEHSVPTQRPAERPIDLARGER